MTQYISKSDLIAEINKRIMDAPIDCNGHQRVWAYNDVKDILNPLEVKEVDLDREIRRYRMRNPIIQHREESLYDYMANVAKHFFELGLNAQKGE